MRAIDRLKRDHALLRSKLDVLEAALGMDPSSTWYVLREMCWTLSRQIQDHIKREEQIVTACRKSLSLEVLIHVKLEHENEPQILRALNFLFVEGQNRAMRQVRATLSALIPRLRQHMDQEESELFPTIERFLQDQEESDAGVPAFPGLREEMTVNAVLHEHPETRVVFEWLFINIPLEGYDCLDEVAWRRGMDCEKLLGCLQEASDPGKRSGTYTIETAHHAPWGPAVPARGPVG